MTELSIYLDTSALLPYYRQEQLSTTVQTLLQNTARDVFISDLTEVEVFSALARLQRMQELNQDQVTAITEKLEEHIQEGLFQKLALDQQSFQQAKSWLKSGQTALRTLDALHLACVFFARVELVTADTVLAQSAQHFGVPVQLL
ncbi:MAG: type II toxin-antitoxin system VapC family toxin [Prochlorothrix sp.]